MALCEGLSLASCVMLGENHKLSEGRDALWVVSSIRLGMPSCTLPRKNKSEMALGLRANVSPSRS
jgi:hypothetical protein